MKEYFSHDYHATSDEKIIRLLQKMGYEGYGIFWRIVEKIYENDGTIKADYELLAYDMRTLCERIKSVCEDFGLFEISDGNIVSESITRRLEERAEKSAKAKGSAMKKWENHANAMRTLCDGRGIKGKERKGKEIKEEGILSVDDLEKAISGPKEQRVCPLMVAGKCQRKTHTCQVKGVRTVNGQVCVLPDIDTTAQ